MSGSSSISTVDLPFAERVRLSHEPIQNGYNVFVLHDSASCPKVSLVREADRVKVAQRFSAGYRDPNNQVRERTTEFTAVSLTVSRPFHGLIQMLGLCTHR